MHAETAYVFRHALYRDAAYQLQPPGERGGLHALALELLEALLDTPALAQQRAGLSEDMANHALAARVPGVAAARWQQLEAAEVRLLLQAARHELMRWRYGAAVQLAQRAVDLPIPDNALRLDALQLRAESLSNAGRLDEALAGFEQAAEVARKVSDARALVGVQISIAMMEMRRGNFEHCEALSRNLVHECAQVGDAELQGRAWQVLAQVLGRRGMAREALAATDKAAVFFRQCHAYDRLGGLLTDRAVRLTELGRREESGAMIEEALAMYRAKGDKPRMANLLSAQAMNAGDAGDIELSMALFDQSNAMAHSIGLIDVMANNEMNRAIQLSHVSRNEEALASLDRAQLLMVETGSRAALGSLANNRASVLLALRRLDEAQRWIALSDEYNRALGREVGVVINRLNHGELAHLRGDNPGAATHMLEAAADLERRGKLPTAVFALARGAACLVDSGEVSRAAQTMDHARGLLAQCEPGPEIRLAALAQMARVFRAAGRDGAREIATQVLHDPDFRLLGRNERADVEQACREALA